MAHSHRKGKVLEREVGRWLLEHDGPCPVWGEMASENARVGHITELGFDIISQSYAAEAKHREAAPQWIFKAAGQVEELAQKHGKNSLLVLKKDARSYPVLHCISPERHAELLAKEAEDE